jgi:hypothetical protein
LRVGRSGLTRTNATVSNAEFRLVMFVAGAAMRWADAAFGFAAWRLGVVTRWGALALAIGSVLAFLGMDRLGLARAELAWLFTPGRAARHCSERSRLDPPRA